jgi:hypothetical protein
MAYANDISPLLNTRYLIHSGETYTMSNVLKIKDSMTKEGKTFMIFTDHILYLSSGVDTERAAACTIIHLVGNSEIKIFRPIGSVLAEISNSGTISKTVEKSLSEEGESTFSRASYFRMIAEKHKSSKPNPFGLSSQEKIQLEVMMDHFKGMAEERRVSTEIQNLSSSVVNALLELGYSVRRQQNAPYGTPQASGEITFEVSFAEI